MKREAHGSRSRAIRWAKGALITITMIFVTAVGAQVGTKAAGIMVCAIAHGDLGACIHSAADRW